MENTPLKETVLNILKQEGKPMSVPELLLFLKKKKLSPNKTSLYRLLKKLQRKQLVDEVLLDSNISFYEITTRHHHHFICKKCKKNQCIEENKSLEKAVHELEHKLEHKGLQIQSHQLSFSGLCKNCIS